MRWLFWLSCLSMISTCALAQVYMWKDESGKLHYSDQRRVDHAEATQIDIGSMPPPPLVQAMMPLAFPANVAPLLLDSFFYARSVSKTEKALITYYFGDDCVAPASQNFNQLRTHYPRVLRDEHSLMVDVFRAFRIKAYRNLFRSGHHTVPDGEDESLLKLNGVIVELKINACRSRLPAPVQSGDLENVRVDEFDLVNAWLKVRWSLRRPGQAEPVFTAATEGVAATRLDQRLDLTGAVRVAFEMAANNLIASDAFRAQLILPEGAVSAPVATPFDDVLTSERALYQNALQRSNFARVMAEMAKLKAAIAEYYHLRGVMPESLDDLAVEPVASRYIESVSMRAPGVIYAQLAQEHLSGNHFIELTPHTHGDFTSIDWQCTTSLPSAVTADRCRQP